MLNNSTFLIFLRLINRMKSKRQNIVLSDKFLNQINSRASIFAILNRLKRNKHYSIDFKDIDFISRAAAHELVSLQSKLLNRDIDVTYINVSNNVNLMINRVEESKKTNTKNATFVKHLTFKDESELNNYLLTL